MSEYLKSHWKDPKLASLITQKVCFLTLQLNHALLLISLRQVTNGAWTLFVPKALSEV